MNALTKDEPPNKTAEFYEAELFGTVLVVTYLECIVKTLNEIHADHCEYYRGTEGWSLSKTFYS